MVTRASARAIAFGGLVRVNTDRDEVIKQGAIFIDRAAPSMATRDPELVLAILLALRGFLKAVY